jgi:rhomboid protease GluP
MKQMEKRRMCPSCRAFITTDDRVCPYCNEKVGARAIDRRSPSPILGGLIPHAQFTTIVILVINAGLFVATMLNGSLLELGGSLRAAVRLGQFWRLVTAGFLHGGLLHIGMNSWVLYDVGSQVEQIYGASRMLAIYFVATVLGFYASTVWQAGLSVGASAGIMGLIGAMIALSAHHQSAVTLALRGQYIRWVIYMLILGMLPGLRVDNAAHIGGLAGGFGVAYLCGLPRWEGAWQERLWRIVSYVCIAVTAFCFFEMYRWITASGQQL